MGRVPTHAVKRVCSLSSATARSWNWLNRAWASSLRESVEMHPYRYDPIDSSCCETSFSAFRTRSKSATGAVSERLVDVAVIPTSSKRWVRLIDAAQKTIEPFGELGRVEAWEERAEIPAGKLIRLDSGRCRVR